MLGTQQLAATTQITDDSALTNATEAGSYPVKLTITENGQTVETTIYVTIYYQRTNENTQAGEAIDAHDIEINTGYFAKLSDADLIKLTNAHAWQTTNNNPIAITSVTRQTINKDAGTYQVTFATANMTATTVNVVERDIAYMQVGEKYFYNIGSGYYITAFSIVSLILLLVLLVVFLHNTTKYVKEAERVEDLLYIPKK